MNAEELKVQIENEILGLINDRTRYTLLVNKVSELKGLDVALEMAQDLKGMGSRSLYTFFTSDAPVMHALGSDLSLESVRLRRLEVQKSLGVVLSEARDLEAVIIARASKLKRLRSLRGQLEENRG